MSARRKTKRVSRGGKKILSTTTEHNELIKLWILRILFSLQQTKTTDFIKEYLIDARLIQILGLDYSKIKSMSGIALHRLFETELNNIEANKPSLENDLKRNLSFLKAEIGLNKTERKLLAFTLILQTNNSLNIACDYLGVLSPEAIINALAVILDLDIHRVRHALSRQSTLYQSGILILERKYEDEMSSMLELIEGYHVLLEPFSDASGLLGSFFHPAGKGSLYKRDFDHLAREFRVAVEYLGHITKNNISGTNILLYGPPGTGKTEFAKTISQRIGANLYEIATTDIENEPLSENRRLVAYRLAQKALKGRKRALLLFDEVESLLEGGINLFHLFGRINESLPTKAYTNQLLESNNIPAIWVANNIENVDKAYIRRFGFVIHFDHPPRKVRKKIINKYLSGITLSKKCFKSIADNKNISPAMIARAAEVVTTLKHANQNEVEENLELIIENNLSAMGYRKTSFYSHDEVLPYSLEALNPDMDLKLLLNGLAKMPEARLCLHGPPGTGKTKFGHYMANRLGKQLVAQRASDILDAYVGGTEVNISAMFQSAKRENAILLLDEADSFLRDRGKALRSWEITQVNELLTQMEQFQGIFICSTNLMENLDIASLRRFDLKIKFDYLNTSQALLLFELALNNKKPDWDTKEWKFKLAALDCLTPGDFVAAVRSSQISDSTLTPQYLFEYLAKENSLKSNYRSGNMGFDMTC